MAASTAALESLGMSHDMLTLLPLNDEPVDFDYGAFISDEDLGYLAEDSSSNAVTESASDSLATQSVATVRRDSTAQGQLKHRLERRGHTKSRRGCFNCKRRRIKCQETRPACGHCSKSGLQCEYPVVPLIVHQPQDRIPIFSMQDMRFHQHYLLNCIPDHPIGSDAIWRHEVPCMSMKLIKYEYLMHAILGLAASDLMQHDPTLLASAMEHRLKAIKAIKKALASTTTSSSSSSSSSSSACSPPSSSATFEEGNALMATCFALTFQSVLLDDGAAEYMTFIRGVIIVGIQMYVRGAAMVCGRFLGEGPVNALQPYMEPLPLVEQSWVDAALASLEQLATLCCEPVEKEYCEKLLEMARQLKISSWGAYKAMTQQYTWWMMLPHEQFQRIVDPANQRCTMLGAHWIALKQIMATITEKEHGAGPGRDAPPKDPGDMDLGMIRWLKYLNRSVDDEHAAYNLWPVWVENQLDRDMGFFGKTR